MTYAQSAIDEFSDPDKLPRIAISVDMLDTGIDVPEILNLVFFKKVMSKAKFWQMIGRGTRLCPGLINGEDKDQFCIFDVCGNFEFFRLRKGKGESTPNQMPLQSAIFFLKAQIVCKLQDLAYQTEALISFRQQLVQELLSKVQELNRDNFAVRQHLRYVEKFSDPASYQTVRYEDTLEIKDEMAPLIQPDAEEVSAVRFDALMYGIELAYLAGKTYSRARKDLVKKVQGIACAGDLAALGYEVTVFEKLAYAGGILTYGIPTFVLPRSVVDRALKTLWAQGVEIVTGAPVDGARTVDDLFAAGYQAVFVGNGADVPQVPPGLDTTLAGVWTANDYLTQVNLHSGELPESIRAAKRVLVVGGGNVAVDAVRCARRLGAETIMVYRRTIAEAPARRDEIAHTYEENIPIRELTNPVACYGENGVLTVVKCEKMALGEPDASGRRRPVGTGEFFDVPCDNLVIATGTSYSEEVVDTTTGIQKDRWGGIAAGEDGQTSRPGVFAGGDAVTGPKTVVQAMGAGKRAAVSIDKYLSER